MARNEHYIRHCEERSDEAIYVELSEIAAPTRIPGSQRQAQGNVISSPRKRGSGAVYMEKSGF